MAFFVYTTDTDDVHFIQREEPMVVIEERDDVTPICPHCKTDLHKVFSQITSGLLGKRYIYFCPECKSVLGVSHRKGFWMG